MIQTHDAAVSALEKRGRCMARRRIGTAMAIALGTVGVGADSAAAQCFTEDFAAIRVQLTGDCGPQEFHDLIVCERGCGALEIWAFECSSPSAFATAHIVWERPWWLLGTHVFLLNASVGRNPRADPEGRRVSASLSIQDTITLTSPALVRLTITREQLGNTGWLSPQLIRLSDFATVLHANESSELDPGVYMLWFEGSAVWDDDDFGRSDVSAEGELVIERCGGCDRSLPASAALGQCDSDWMNTPYAPREYDVYLNKLRAQLGRPEQCENPPTPLDVQICQLVALKPNCNIGAKGCELTAYATTLRLLGIDDDATPVSVQAKIEQADGGGFTPIKFRYPDKDGLCRREPKPRVPVFSGLDVAPDAVLASYRRLRQYKDIPQDALDFDTRIEQALQQCRVVHLRESGCHHWIVVRDRRPLPLGGYEYLIDDPGTVGAPEWRPVALCTTDAARVFGVGPANRERAVVRTNCPVRTRLVDPLGREMVFDSSNGLISSELPDAWHDTIFPTSTPESGFTPEEIAQMLPGSPSLVMFEDVVDGLYTVELTGLGDGPYSVDARWFPNGVRPGYAHFEGTIQTGQVVSHSFGLTVCAADFNGDGFLDFFDFAIFVDCFEGFWCPEGRSADFNRDGFPDFFDFSDYIDAFEAGC